MPPARGRRWGTRLHGHRTDDRQGHVTWCGYPIEGNLQPRTPGRRLVLLTLITDNVREVTCQRCHGTTEAHNARIADGAPEPEPAEKPARKRRRPAEPSAWERADRAGVRVGARARVRPAGQEEPIVHGEVAVIERTSIALWVGDEPQPFRFARFDVEVLGDKAGS